MQVVVERCGQEDAGDAATPTTPAVTPAPILCPAIKTHGLPATRRAAGAPADPTSPPSWADDLFHAVFFPADRAAAEAAALWILKDPRLRRPKPGGQQQDDGARPPRLRLFCIPQARR